MATFRQLQARILLLQFSDYQLEFFDFYLLEGSLSVQFGHLELADKLLELHLLHFESFDGLVEHFLFPHKALEKLFFIIKRSLFFHKVELELQNILA